MALSANATGSYRASGGALRDFVVTSGATIYKGSVVMIAAAGGLSPAADAANTFVAGIALDEIVGDGTVVCRVDIGGAEVKMTQTDGTQTAANIGDAQVSVSDNSCQATGGSSIPLGRITEAVDGTTVWVKLYPMGTVS